VVLGKSENKSCSIKMWCTSERSKLTNQSQKAPKERNKYERGKGSDLQLLICGIFIGQEAETQTF
jgi:hypothetical protein